MGPLAFRHGLLDILRRLSKHTPARRIFVLGMLPIKPDFEKIAPGTKRSVRQYNNIMREVAGRFENSVYLDMEDIFGESIEQAQKDSIHFTAYGHKKIAEYISVLINEEAR